MNKFMEQRIYDTAEYILKTKCTVREAAKGVNSSKSTVYKDMSERLVQLDPKLAGEIRDIILENKVMRAERGGEATKKKWKDCRND